VVVPYSVHTPAQFPSPFAFMFTQRLPNQEHSEITQAELVTLQAKLWTTYSASQGLHHQALPDDEAQKIANAICISTVACIAKSQELSGRPQIHTVCVQLTQLRRGRSEAINLFNRRGFQKLLDRNPRISDEQRNGSHMTTLLVHVDKISGRREHKVEKAVHNRLRAMVSSGDGGITGVRLGFEGDGVGGPWYGEAVGQEYGITVSLMTNAAPKKSWKDWMVQVADEKLQKHSAVSNGLGAKLLVGDTEAQKSWQAKTRLVILHAHTENPEDLEAVCQTLQDKSPLVDSVVQCKALDDIVQVLADEKRQVHLYSHPKSGLVRSRGAGASDGGGSASIGGGSGSGGQCLPNYGVISLAGTHVFVTGRLDVATRMKVIGMANARGAKFHGRFTPSILKSAKGQRLLFIAGNDMPPSGKAMIADAIKASQPVMYNEQFTVLYNEHMRLHDSGRLGLQEEPVERRERITRGIKCDSVGVQHILRTGTRGQEVHLYTATVKKVCIGCCDTESEAVAMCKAAREAVSPVSPNSGKDSMHRAAFNGESLGTFKTRTMALSAYKAARDEAGRETRDTRVHDEVKGDHSGDDEDEDEGIEGGSPAHLVTNDRNNRGGATKRSNRDMHSGADEEEDEQAAATGRGCSAQSKRTRLGASGGADNRGRAGGNARWPQRVNQKSENVLKQLTEHREDVARKRVQIIAASSFCDNKREQLPGAAEQQHGLVLGNGPRVSESLSDSEGPDNGEGGEP